MWLVTDATCGLAYEPRRGQMVFGKAKLPSLVQ
jgi:hypothetical protein